MKKRTQYQLALCQAVSRKREKAMKQKSHFQVPVPKYLYSL